VVTDGVHTTPSFLSLSLKIENGSQNLTSFITTRLCCTVTALFPYLYLTMPIEWDIAELKSRGFRTGSVLRVYMHNFLIYDDAQVFPGYQNI
jgi:hypothetical protein